MRGVLFGNKEKRGNQPDFKGSCEIEGCEYWVSGWKKVSNSGDAYMSLSFTKKEVQNKAESLRDFGDDEIDDEIPF